MDKVKVKVKVDDGHHDDGAAVEDGAGGTGKEPDDVEDGGAAVERKFEMPVGAADMPLLVGKDAPWDDAEGVSTPNRSEC